MPNGENRASAGGRSNDLRVYRVRAPVVDSLGGRLTLMNDQSRALHYRRTARQPGRALAWVGLPSPLR